MITSTAAILVIGNEILSGRTHDTNVRYIAQHLQQAGIVLDEVRVIPDRESIIIKHVNALRADYDYVFTTGGIGSTHDDITAASVAKAFGVPFDIHTEALARIEQQLGDQMNDNCRRMAFMPKGSGLIDNSVSKVPGFYIENVYCLAGMPSIMRCMFDALLPTLKHGAPFVSNTVTCALLERQIAQQLEDIQSAFPTVDIGSYPFYDKESRGVSLVIKGQDQTVIQSATDRVITLVQSYGVTADVVRFNQ
jgi:molybdenum cofactor synthesis domain-containing protein